MKYFLFLFLVASSLCGYGQEMLHNVITDYQMVRSKNKVVKITLPENTATAFYRVTVFNANKVNTYDGFMDVVRSITADELRKPNYDFSKHALESNSASGVDVFFMNDAKVAEGFKSGKAADTFAKVDDIKQSVGRLDAPPAKEIYVGISPKQKNQPMYVKTELLALAPVTSSDVNDKYPYSIQNENDTTVVFEVSGNRKDWDVFHVPKCKKAEFKLASDMVYFRVSTLMQKTTEEYKLYSDKFYRLFWNKDSPKVDLAEIGATQHK